MNKKIYFEQLIKVSHISSEFQSEISRIQGLADALMRLQDPNMYKYVDKLCCDLHTLYVGLCADVADALDVSSHNNDADTVPSTTNE